MPCVLRRETLTDEDVAEMAAAGGAFDLDAMPVRIRQPANGAFYLLIERRPTAAGVELRVRDIERRLARPADVRALDEEVVVFAGERRLGPLVHDDPCLCRREVVER